MTWPRLEQTAWAQQSASSPPFGSSGTQDERPAKQTLKVGIFKWAGSDASAPGDQRSFEAALRTEPTDAQQELNSDWQLVIESLPISPEDKFTDKAKRLAFFSSIGKMFRTDVVMGYSIDLPKDPQGAHIKLDVFELESNQFISDIGTKGCMQVPNLIPPDLKKLPPLNGSDQTSAEKKRALLTVHLAQEVRSKVLQLIASEQFKPLLDFERMRQISGQLLVDGTRTSIPAENEELCLPKGCHELRFQPDDRLNYHEVVFRMNSETSASEPQTAQTCTRSARNELRSHLAAQRRARSGPRHSSVLSIPGGSRINDSMTPAEDSPMRAETWWGTNAHLARFANPCVWGSLGALTAVLLPIGAMAADADGKCADPSLPGMRCARVMDTKLHAGFLLAFGLGGGVVSVTSAVLHGVRMKLVNSDPKAARDPVLRVCARKSLGGNK